MKKLILSTAIIVLTSSLLSASYKDALELFSEHKYKESLQMIAGELDITKDMESDSPNFNLRYLAAHNHWKLGNTTSSIAHFKRCADIQKDNINPLIDLTMLLIEKKRYGDARYFANMALKIKENPLVFYALGNAALGYRNYWRAKEHFEKSISIDPELSISYNGLGIVLMRLKKYSEANTAFSAAQAMMPDSPEVLNNIATSLKMLGRLDEAYDYYTKASAKKPGDPVIKINMERLKDMIEKNKKE